MEILHWNERFSVGNKNIDLQHKKLFSLINYLLTGTEPDKIEEIIGELVVYTDYHFSFEEELMRSHPSIEAHCNLHAKFVKKIRFFEEEFKLEKETIHGDLFSFLVSWIRDHILETDSTFFSELNQETV